MLYSFVLTTLAGLTTLIGTIPIFVKIKNKNKLIAATCAFASGVMVCVSIIDLVPEGINYLKNGYNSFLVIIIAFMAISFGIFTSIFLDKITTTNDNNTLYQTGILAMIVIIIHNIPEGIITYIVSSNNITLGISMALAIAIHNIPEGISIAIPIYYATSNKFKAICYTFISAISELVGALLAYFILSNIITAKILGIILSFTAGIMMAISLFKLFPTGYKFNHKLAKIWSIIGFIFMLFSLLLNSLVS